MSAPRLPATYQLADGRLAKLRPLEEADLPDLEWEGEYRHFRRLYQGHYRSCKHGYSCSWVACDESNRAIGQVFILLNSKDTNVADGQHCAYLYSFRIRENWRGQGLGNYMLAYVEEQLALRDYMWLRLNVAKDNPAARRLYERRAYVVIGSDPGIWQYQDEFGAWHTIDEPAWKMIKALR